MTGHGPGGRDPAGGDPAKDDPVEHDPVDEGGDPACWAHLFEDEGLSGDQPSAPRDPRD